MKKLTPEALQSRRTIIIADLLSKVDAEDWHGTADCSMDLREIDAQLESMKQQLAPTHTAFTDHI